MSRPDFSKLDKYMADWALPSVEERIAKRSSSTLEAMQEFHDAMLPELEDIIDFLNQFPCDDIPGEYLALKNTVLSLLHVDRPVNRWQKALLDDARDPRIFRMKKSFYDSASPD